MRWELKHGRYRERLEKRAAKGKHTPELDELPEIAGLEWIWDGFTLLQTERSMGMAAGPIPWSAALRYARYQRMSAEEFYHFWECVSHMDDIVIGYGRELKRGATDGRSTRTPNRRNRSR